MDPSLEVARCFSANLHRTRKRSGLSQEQVGWLADLHRTEIGLLEKGARIPRIDTLVKVAAALGLPIKCPLLEGIVWEPATSQPGRFEVSFGHAGTESPPDAQPR